LYLAYNKLKQFDNAMKYALIFIETKKHMFNEEKIKAITEMEKKYQAEKKQLEIEKMEKQKLLDNQIIKLQNEENKKQRIIILSTIIGLCLVVFSLIILIRMFSIKKKANKLLNDKNEEISAQRDEIAAQRDLAAQQRDLITEQKQDITESIQYAYRIQSAAIPPVEILQDILTDYFIFYKPRDIVSGDFYWISEQDHKLIIIAADCTGHGVPGAFMSMLGIAFLNEIVNKENITKPSEILSKLRQNIIKALQQSGKDGEQRDGMDVAAITIDLRKNILEFAGANNPLYLIRNEELIEKKGSKMPVSIHRNMSDYENHIIKVDKKDTIYIFSDGYPDQFGGPNGKKFKYKPFKELLVSIQNQPMKIQNQLLEENFESWKGNLEQIDDVLVIGVKI